jgi:hypothetical protein
VAAIIAYLDAGSGSMIVQLLLGGAAAAIVSVKLWWQRVLRLLHIRPREPRETEASPTAGD